MAEEIKDTQWEDMGNGIVIRSLGSFKAPDKPFSMDDMKNTWAMQVPDGNGNIICTYGRWVDGKMVEDFKETIKDPLPLLKEMIKK